MIQRVYDIQGDLEELYGMVDEMRTIEVWVTTTDDPDGEPHLMSALRMRTQISSESKQSVSGLPSR